MQTNMTRYHPDYAVDFQVQKKCKTKWQETLLFLKIKLQGVWRKG